MDVCSFLCSFPPSCSLISHWIINGTVLSAFLFLFVCVHCSRLIALSAFLPLFFSTSHEATVFFFFMYACRSLLLRLARFIVPHVDVYASVC